jgi:hypothetical protein
LGARMENLPAGGDGGLHGAAFRSRARQSGYARRGRRSPRGGVLFARHAPGDRGPPRAMAHGWRTCPPGTAGSRPRRQEYGGLP